MVTGVPVPTDPPFPPPLPPDLSPAQLLAAGDRAEVVADAIQVFIGSDQYEVRLKPGTPDAAETLKKICEIFNENINEPGSNYQSLLEGVARAKTGTGVINFKEGKLSVFIQSKMHGELQWQGAGWQPVAARVNDLAMKEKGDDDEDAGGVSMSVSHAPAGAEAAKEEEGISADLSAPPTAPLAERSHKEDELSANSQLVREVAKRVTSKFTRVKKFFANLGDKIGRSGDGNKGGLDTLRYINTSTYKDLQQVGITSVDDLRQFMKEEAGGDPHLAADLLYEKYTGWRSSGFGALYTLRDPAKWDLFAACIHEAQTGERLHISHFTAIRLLRESDLYKLEHVTPEVYKDLREAGITSINDLKAISMNNEFYTEATDELMVKAGTSDPKKWALFAALLHEAQSAERLPIKTFSDMYKQSVENMAEAARDEIEEEAARDEIEEEEEL